SNIPSIRFKEFTHAWEQDLFGSILKKVDERGYEYLPQLTASINYGMILKENNTKVKSLANFKRVTENDFVLHLSSYNCGLAFSELEGLTSPAYSVLRFTSSSKYNPFFWKYVFKSNKFINSLIPLTYGLRVGKSINFQELEKNLLTVPSKEEQTKIAKLLLSLDSVFSLHKRKCILLKNIRKSLFYKMFPSQNSVIFPLKFEKATHTWEQDVIQNLFNITRGYVLSTKKISESKTGIKKFPVYSSQTLNNGLLGYYDKFLYKDAITWTTDGANAGTVNFREGKFYCTNVCGVLLEKTYKPNLFLANALARESFKFVMKAGNPKLMNNIVAEIKINITKQINEQEKISKLFTSIDSLLSLHKRKRLLIKKVKWFCKNSVKMLINLNISKKLNIVLINVSIFLIKR
ncbi:restriction endonuclease subunit S, partial [Mycoplasma sp. 1012]